MQEYTLYKRKLKPTIVDEAMRCFSEQGIRAVRMDDIARNLGISKRTLYELYSNKEELLLEVIRKACAQRDEEIAHFKEDCDNVMDLLIRILRMQLERVSATNSKFYLDLRRYKDAEHLLESRFAEERKKSHGFFMQGVKEGYFLPNIDYPFFLIIVARTMRMVKTDDGFVGIGYKQLFLNFIYPLVRGICTVKGIEKIDAFIEELD